MTTATRRVEPHAASLASVQPPASTSSAGQSNQPFATPSASTPVRSLLGLQGAPRELLVSLLSRAADLERSPQAAASRLAGATVATLFFEDSTRTKTSFTLAARRLGAEVADLSGGSSSVNKGETLIDTARTIEAMGVHAIVVRARQSGAAQVVQSSVAVPVINAGDGRHEHPTQGLLDAYTIARAHDRADFDLAGLTIAIVGDVASSRVARSNIAGLTTLGAKVICVGPPGMAPRSLEGLGASVSNDLDKVLPHADAVMMLRIQFERHGEGGDPKLGPQAAAPSSKSNAIPSIREYREFFALTPERAAHLKPGAIVMHPGPMNRGIEIDSAVADGPRSAIVRQVSHGLLIRMAVLDWCVRG